MIDSSLAELGPSSFPLLLTQINALLHLGNPIDVHRVRWRVLAFDSRFRDLRFVILMAQWIFGSHAVRYKLTTMHA